jgi:hypothetical protein
MDDVAGVAVAPEQDTWRLLGFHVPPEQTRSIARFKPDLLERKTADARPVPLDPGSRVVDEQLIEDVGHVALLRLSATQEAVSYQPSALRWRIKDGSAIHELIAES